MAQGYTGYTILENQITIKDSPNLDAFSRFRVSNPLTIFSNQFTYDLSPLVFEQYGFGSYTVTHITDRSAKISLASAAANDFIYMQSYEYIPYQPGRSQLVFITFNMFPTGTVTNDTIRTVGLGDNDNGFFFRYNGAIPGLEFVIVSSTALGGQSIDQANWNLDKLNGTGPSGKSLNEKKTQILVIDFQALYVGRVRFGFDTDGEIIYAHEFLHANIKDFPYIATANLPIRVGMFALTAPAITEEMDFICCSVASEGGLDDSQKFGYTFSQEGSYLTLGTASTHIISLRPTTAFNGFTNRSKIIIQDIEIVNVGNRAVFWSLGLGAVLNTPTYNPHNATYSGVEFDIAGTFTSGPTIIINSGYVPSTVGTGGGTLSTDLTNKYPITLDALGNNRDLGTLTLSANAVGAGTTDIYYSVHWKEIR